MVWGNTQNIIIHSDGNPLVYFDDSMVANPSGTLNPGGMAHLRSIPAMMNIHILMI